MSAKRSRRAAVLAIVLSMAWPLTGQGEGDITPPDIAHTPLEHFPSDMPLRIQARVTDDSGVREVVLFYRNAGAGAYKRMPMTRISNGSLYAATLPADAGPRIEYYIQAADTAGNSVLGKLFDPYVIEIEQRSVAASAPPPAIASTPAPAAAAPAGSAAASNPVPTPAPASAPVSAQASAVQAPAPRAVPQPDDKQRSGISRWVWVGLGVVALAAIAGSGGGGGGGDGEAVSGPTSGTGSVTINAPVP